MARTVVTEDAGAFDAGGVPLSILEGSVTEAEITLADNTTNDVSTAKHGFAPKAPNDATKFLNGLGAYAVPASGAVIGGTVLVYRYTVAGSVKASIDTGVDAAQAGSNDWTNGDVLEIYVYGRTDQAATTSTITMTVNNDTSAVYDRAFLNNTNAAVTGGNSLAQAGWAIGIAGDTAAAGTFAHLFFACPNYTGAVGNKQVAELGGTLGQTAATATITNQNFTWRPASPAAITRLKIVPATGGVSFKIGTQLLIYKRTSV